MNYTIHEIASISELTEHTIRYYTDQNLLPCQRDKANRRVFDDESLNWIHTIKCMKGCGMSIEEIRQYCALCREPETKATIQKRFEMILSCRDQAYERLEEAKSQVAFIEKKLQFYQGMIGEEKVCGF